MSRVYDTRDAARAINTTVRAIRHAINRGKLKASKFGKAYMITEDDLQEYAEYRKKNGYDYDE